MEIAESWNSIVIVIWYLYILLHRIQENVIKHENLEHSLCSGKIYVPSRKLYEVKLRTSVRHGNGTFVLLFFFFSWAMEIEFFFDYYKLWIGQGKVIRSDKEFFNLKFLYLDTMNH